MACQRPWMGLEPTAIRHRLRRKSTALNHCATEAAYAWPALAVSDQKRTRSQYHSIKHARPPLSTAWRRRQNKKIVQIITYKKILQILKKKAFWIAVRNRCMVPCNMRNTDHLLNNISIHIRLENTRDMQRKKVQHHHSKGPCPACHLLMSARAFWMVMLNFFRCMSLAFSRRMWIEMLWSRWSVLRTLQGTMHRSAIAHHDSKSLILRICKDFLYVIICTIFLFCRLHHAVLRGGLACFLLWYCDIVLF